MLHLNFRCPHLQQLGITPDMFVALLFREIEAVQVLCYLPKLCLERVVWVSLVCEYLTAAVIGVQPVLTHQGVEGLASSRS